MGGAGIRYFDFKDCTGIFPHPASPGIQNAASSGVFLDVKFWKFYNAIGQKRDNPREASQFDRSMKRKFSSRKIGPFVNIDKPSG